MDNLIDTVGEGVKSDVSSGEIRGCVMLAQSSAIIQFDTERQAETGMDAHIHKQTDRQTSRHTQASYIIFFNLYFHLSYLMYCIFIYCCDWPIAF